MKWLVSTVLVSLALTGCGSSNKSESNTPTNTTTPPVVAEPTPVHTIQPAEIPAYLAEFKQQQSEVSIQFDGVEKPYRFLTIDEDSKTLGLLLDNGLLLLGYDMEQEEALPSLTFIKGDPSDLDGLLSQPDDVYTGPEVDLSEHDENYIYQGSLINAAQTSTIAVRAVANESILTGGSAEIEIEGDQAMITGALGTNFYIQLEEMIAQHPEVTTLVLSNVEGSVNDGINMHSGRLVRNAQLTTLMPSDGEAYSGGVDLFAAGYKRIYQTGGVLGVHSWCCENGKDAGQLGKTHAAHGAQLTYFREMLGAELGPEFYFFTIDAAPFDSIHNMTLAEVNQYLSSEN